VPAKKKSTASSKKSVTAAAGKKLLKTASPVKKKSPAKKSPAKKRTATKKTGAAKKKAGASASRPVSKTRVARKRPAAAANRKAAPAAAKRKPAAKRAVAVTRRQTRPAKLPPAPALATPAVSVAVTGGPVLSVAEPAAVLEPPSPSKTEAAPVAGARADESLAFGRQAQSERTAAPDRTAERVVTGSRAPRDTSAAIWARIEENTNLVAHAHDLIQPDETFALTEDQARAVAELDAGLAAGGFEFLLKAPTGSGKTEVMFRVGVREALRSGGYVCLVAPTRDLVRQDCTYFRDRLEGTGLGVGEAHGGISPGERRAMLDGVMRGETRFIIGSAMMISVPPLWDVLDRSALTIIDDVNAFDEREHLRLLEDLDCPLLFASATPQELQRFLERVGAFKNTIAMRGMPFDVLPTKVHKTPGVWGEPATEQLARADALIREHIERKSRIFVIARTRGDVPKLAQRLEETYGITAQQLRGDMADSAEHKKRNRRSGVTVYGTSTRVEEMRAFREGAPAILAATNLVGSGLDIPAADLIVITDSDAFGESEIEQLIGRVGRRERPSDAVLLVETTFEKNPSRAMGASGRAQTFMPSGMRSNSLRFRRR